MVEMVMGVNALSDRLVGYLLFYFPNHSERSRFIQGRLYYGGLPDLTVAVASFATDSPGESYCQQSNGDDRYNYQTHSFGAYKP